MADDLRARYLAYLELCNAHRFDDLAAFLAPSIRTEDGDVVPGEYITRLERLHTSFADIRWMAAETVVEERALAARLFVTARHTGRYADIPPSGRAHAWTEYAFYGWKDGRITSYHGLGEDLATALRR